MRRQDFPFSTGNLIHNRKIEQVYEHCIRRNWVAGGEYDNLPYPWIASGGGFGHYFAACDAALGAMLTAAVEPDRTREMFRNFWHWMVHNPNFPEGSAGYGMIPGIARVDHGPYFWTFKLSQTPFLAWGIWEAYRQDPQEGFLGESLPHLLTNHDWYVRERDVDGDLLAEMGAYTQMERNLRFESIEAALDPTEEEVANEMRDYWACGRPGIRTKFARRMTNREGRLSGERWYADLESVEMTAGLVLMEKSIARIAAELGADNLASDYLDLARRREQAMNQYMWDAEDGCYYDLHRDTHEVFRLKTAMAFMPMVSGSCSMEQAESLVHHLMDPDQFWTRFPVTTFSREAIQDPDRARLESSVLVNFLLSVGLNRYGYREQARRLTDATVARVREPFWAGRWDSDTGEPLGPHRAASASLVILMIWQNHYGMRGRFRVPAAGGDV